MKTFFDYLQLIFLSLLVSCSPIAFENQTKVGTATILAYKTPIESQPAESAILLTQVSNSAEQCFGFQQDLPKNLIGEIVFSGKDILTQPILGLYETPPYILVLATGDKLTLPLETGDRVENFSISPNKEWLAYFAHQSNTVGEIYIVGNNGVLFRKYPGNDWWNILRWLDNDHLLVSKFAHQNPYPSLVFNPFTGKTEQELLPKYPDIFAGYSGELSTWGAFQLPETVYNSDLSMVVYPKNPNTIILWDIKANKEIHEIIDLSASSQEPLWLSNGKEFIIDVTAKNTTDNWYQDELMSVGIDGQIKQLTDLAGLYKNVAIQNYSESADGRYVAFWFAQVHSGPSRLAVYDITTSNVKVFCTIVGGYLPPVWSPTEHQLLVDGTFDNLDNYGTIFVDVESGLFAQMEKGVLPAGWIVTP